MFLLVRRGPQFVAQPLTSVALRESKRTSKLTAMNLSEEQFSRHTEKVAKKKDRIEILEALLATHEIMGTQPDSRDIRELKQRIQSARAQLMAMH